VKENGLGRALSMHGKRNACQILVEKPEGTTSLGRPRYRWEDNIKMDLTEIGWAILTGLIWRRIDTSGGLLVKVIMNLRAL
jgi:hypothetical protein